VSDQLALRTNTDESDSMFVTSDHDDGAPRGVDSTPRTPLQPHIISIGTAHWLTCFMVLSRGHGQLEDGRAAHTKTRPKRSPVEQRPSNAAVSVTAHNVLPESAMISRHTHFENDNTL